MDASSPSSPDLHGCSPVPPRAHSRLSRSPRLFSRTPARLISLISRSPRQPPRLCHSTILQLYTAKLIDNIANIGTREGCHPRTRFGILHHDESESWGHREAEKVLRLERWGNPIALDLINGMTKRTISVFIDESGNLAGENDSSRFFLLCLLVHDQSLPIAELVRKFDSDLDMIGLSNLCFHAGPIIRHEDGYEYMNWELRNRIFSMMMAFTRKANFKYRCIVIDKKFVASERQIVAEISAGLSAFIDTALDVPKTETVKVYYDCGQTPITNILHAVFEDKLGKRCTFSQDVRPVKYRLFQVADLICTVSLIAQKIGVGLPLTKSEDKFFGGLRRFKRNVLKPLLTKAI